MNLLFSLELRATTFYFNECLPTTHFKWQHSGMTDSSRHLCLNVQQYFATVNNIGTNILTKSPGGLVVWALGNGCGGWQQGRKRKLRTVVSCWSQMPSVDLEETALRPNCESPSALEGPDWFSNCSYLQGSWRGGWPKTRAYLLERCLYRDAFKE